MCSLIEEMVETQERERTQKKVVTVQHTNDCHYIVNMHSIHHPHLLRALFLPDLYAIPIVQDRKTFHSSIAEKVRIRLKEKAAELQMKRKAREEQKAGTGRAKKTKQATQSVTRDNTSDCTSENRPIGQHQLASPTYQLPPGWECRVTGDGRYYYVDNNTRTSTWYPPWTLQPHWEGTSLQCFFILSLNVHLSHTAHISFSESEITILLYICT